MSPETLRAVALFAQVDDRDLEQIAAKSAVRTFGKHSIVVTESDFSSSLYVLLKGEARAFVSDEDGNVNIVNHLHAGDYFGELSLIDQGPRSASIETVTQCQMLILSRSFFLDYLREHPSVAIRLLEGMAQRLRATTLHAKELALMDVFGRIASVLLKSAAQEDGLLITPPLTQQAIADEVGASREMVSRILKDLRAGGYISVQDKRIVIKQRIPDRW